MNRSWLVRRQGVVPYDWRGSDRKMRCPEHDSPGINRDGAQSTGFWGTLHGEDREIVERSIALVKIENLADRMVHTLSDGERQKVMIAKALAQQTPVIFLDEPTAFLDFSK